MGCRALRCLLVGYIGVLTEQIDGNLLIVDVACVAAMEELKLLTQEVLEGKAPTFNILLN